MTESSQSDSRVGKPAQSQTTDPIEAVQAAEQKAQADHESGACQESGWSCSYCEAEAATTEEGVRSTDTITRLDQLAWEAPQLRPTLIPAGTKETWTLPCPDWCTGDGPGHDVEPLIMGGWRRHQSASLRVRHDSGRVYEVEGDALDEGPGDAARAGNLELALRASSRAPDRPYVQLTIHGGRLGDDGDVEHVEHSVGSWYPDEVREVICVLQHLLKVAQA